MSQNIVSMDMNKSNVIMIVKNGKITLVNVQNDYLSSTLNFFPLGLKVQEMN